MARDYARSRSKQSNHSGAGMTWLVFAIVIGLIVVAMMYVKKHHAEAVKRAEHIHKHKTEKQAKTAETTNTSEQPQFDFYTILPNMKVPGANDNTTSTSTKPANLPPLPAKVTKTLAPVESAKSETKTVKPEAATKPTPTTHYLLQVAAVKNYADADSLKAQLAMLGYDVTVKKISGKTGVLYKITVGPYPSREAAEDVRKQLQANQINSVLVKIP